MSTRNTTLQRRLNAVLDFAQEMRKAGALHIEVDDIKVSFEPLDPMQKIDDSLRGLHQAADELGEEKAENILRERDESLLYGAS